MADVLAPDELHHWGVGDDTLGLTPFTARLTAFLAAFPDIAIHVEKTIATDDYVVTRYTATATHRGTWLGVAPTGKAVTWTGINIFRIACGRIAESWGEADHLRLLQELGGEPNVATPVGTPTG